MNLPPDFARQMQRWLGPSFTDLERAFADSALRAVRLHRTAFVDAANQQEADPIPVPRNLALALLDPVPWSSDSYYIPTDSRLGRHVHHEMGVYYLQEPSAMAVVEALDPKAGERILDLCAAPGGKSTAIAKRMAGTGTLVANEIHPSRVVTLAQNLERLGIDAVVTNESPDVLAVSWRGLFDAVLVDAPCSGEGMFRKDAAAVNEWREESLIFCSSRQREILQCALHMVRPGGRLVYSTCTFNPLENERIIEWLLETFNVSIEALPQWRGFEPARSDWTLHATDVGGARRLWPQSGLGEGHFVCRLRVLGDETTRGGTDAANKRASDRNGKPAHETRLDHAQEQTFRSFLKDIVMDPDDSWLSPIIQGDVAFSRPPSFLPLEGLRVLRPGVALAVGHKGRFEPHHHLSRHLTLQNAAHPRAVDLEEARRYIAGDPLESHHPSGFVWLHHDGFPIGFGKAVAGRINNRYPKGLRKAGLDVEHLPATTEDSGIH